MNAPSYIRAMLLASFAMSPCVGLGMSDTRTGVFFTLPGTGTNGLVAVAADSLCWGKSPETPKRVTLPSMATVLDAFAERYYVMCEGASDPDMQYRYGYGAWEVFQLLDCDIAGWKNLNLYERYISNPWPLATNRVFASAARVFPSGMAKLATVRNSLRYMCTTGYAFTPFGMSQAVGSSLFGSDAVFNVGWCSNEVYDAALDEARANGLGKTYSWLATPPYYWSSLKSCLDWLYDAGSTSWTNRVETETLKEVLEDFLPSGDGGLSDGWVTSTTNAMRITASDFSWMNALLMSMDTYSFMFGPCPVFKIRDASVSGETNATAVIKLEHLHFNVSPTGTPYFSFDATPVSYLVSGELPLTTNSPAIGMSAVWAMDEASAGGRIDYFVTNGVFVSKGDLADALDAAGYQLNAGWTDVDIDYSTLPDGIHVYVVNPDDTLVMGELVHIPTSDIEALGGTKAVTNAKYRADVHIRAPVNNYACLPFAHQGQRWYSRELSGPSLAPTQYTQPLVRKIAVQGGAEWLVMGFGVATNGGYEVMQRMACGDVAESPSAAAADRKADSLVISQIMPGRAEAASAIAGVRDITDAKAIETLLKARLTPSGSDVDQLAVGFSEAKTLEVRKINGQLETRGVETDGSGKIRIGQMVGGVSFVNESSLTTGECAVAPYFSLLITYDFYNLPSTGLNHHPNQTP